MKTGCELTWSRGVEKFSSPMRFTSSVVPRGRLAGMLRPQGQPGLEAKLCGLGLTMVGLGLGLIR